MKSMRTQDTPTMALAYFLGFQDGEARQAVLASSAGLSEVVRSFGVAVARRRVAREAYRSYVAGWRIAERLNGEPDVAAIAGRFSLSARPGQP